MSVGSSTGAFFAFLVAGTVIVLLLFSLAVGIAALRRRTFAGLRDQGPRIKRWAGAVLLVLGLWFLILALWANLFARVFPV